MPDDVLILRIDRPDQFPGWLSPDLLASFLHESLKPYEDPLEDVLAGIEYAMSPVAGKGGFVLAAVDGRDLVGALVLLRTGMKGYVPPNMILYVAVDPARRGEMVGHRLMQQAIRACEGDVKLHVEYDNHARKYYEAIGFESKYADMRLKR